VQAALLPDVLQLRAELADTTDRYQQALLSFWTAPRCRRQAAERRFAGLRKQVFEANGANRPQVHE